MQEPKLELIARIRREIRQGNYESPSKLKVVVDRLLEALDDVECPSRYERPDESIYRARSTHGRRTAH